AAIRKARRPRTQNWLAAKLQVDQTTVSKWEKGTSAPDIGRLPEIERTVSLRPGTLATFYGIGPQNNAEPEQPADADLTLDEQIELLAELPDGEFEQALENLLRQRRQRRAAG
ncbi:MAG: helix-turn-helix domain-containing protein, partial [Pseudonocardiaceae bacterium]|nr:helix-turn-helix domain-containing protein [Pseudonocardiaceae bacterium]